MSRWKALTLGAWAAAAALAADGAHPAAAEERRAQILRMHGGSYLGVSLADVGPEDVTRLRLPGERGALVKEVVEDSPAARSGLKEDDVILTYQGEAVHSAAQLGRLVRETPGGRKVTLGISRGGAGQEVQVTLGEGRRTGRLLEGLEGLDNLDIRLPEMPSLPEIRDREKLQHEALRNVFVGRPRLGIRYHELTEQLARFFKVEGGLLVSDVTEGSPADKGGLRAGDVIVAVDGSPVRDASDLHRPVARAGSSQEITITVQREGRPMDLRVKLEPLERRRPRQPTT